MAKLILNDQEVEVEDGANIVDVIEELGVPIGCSNGVCGTWTPDVPAIVPQFQEEEGRGEGGQRQMKNQRRRENCWFNSLEEVVLQNLGNLE